MENMRIHEELRYLRSLGLKHLLETAQITLEIAKHNNHYLTAQTQQTYDKLKDLKHYDLTFEDGKNVEYLIKNIIIINHTGGKTS